MGEPGAGCERRGGGGKGEVIRIGGKPERGNVDAAPDAWAPWGAGKAGAGLDICGAPAPPLCTAAASSCAVGAGLATHVSMSPSSKPAAAAGVVATGLGWTLDGPIPTDGFVAGAPHAFGGTSGALLGLAVGSALTLGSALVLGATAALGSILTLGSALALGATAAPSGLKTGAGGAGGGTLFFLTAPALSEGALFLLPSAEAATAEGAPFFLASSVAVTPGGGALFFLGSAAATPVAGAPTLFASLDATDALFFISLVFISLVAAVSEGGPLVAFVAEPTPGSAFLFAPPEEDLGKSVCS